MTNRNTKNKMPPSILVEADSLINGPRQDEYGPPEVWMHAIADQWALYLNQKFGFDIALSGEDVCWMMADLKKVRQMVKGKRDNPRDAAGYMGLIEKIGIE